MKKASSRRIIKFFEMIIGASLRGLGCGFLIVANIGSDPITTFNTGLAKIFNFDNFWAFIITNLFFIILLLIFDRKKIGIGTIFSTYLISQGVYFASILSFLASWNKYLVFGIAIIISCIGISLYADANIGFSALDGFVFAMHEKIKIPIKVSKIGIDILFLILGLCFGSKIGIGTIISLLLMGPLIEMFYKLISKLMRFNHV